MPYLKVCKIIYCKNSIICKAAIRSQEFGREDRHIPAYARNTFTITALCANSTGYMGTMIIHGAIKSAVITEKEIPAMYIIYITIAIVVNTINLVKRIVSEIIYKVFMRIHCT